MKKYLYTTIAVLTLALTSVLVYPGLVSAQVSNPDLKAQACQGITSTDTTPTTECGNPGFFSGLVERILNILSIILGGVAIIVLVVAGLMYVASGGDPNNTKRAKDAILYAVIGIVVAIAAQGIVRFVVGNV
jgi:hypothetical protein